MYITYHPICDWRFSKTTYNLQSPSLAKRSAKQRVIAYPLHTTCRFRFSLHTTFRCTLSYAFCPFIHLYHLFAVAAQLAVAVAVSQRVRARNETRTKQTPTPSKPPRRSDEVPRKTQKFWGPP